MNSSKLFVISGLIVSFLTIFSSIELKQNALCHSSEVRPQTRKKTESNWLWSLVQLQMLPTVGSEDFCLCINNVSALEARIKTCTLNEIWASDRLWHDGQVLIYMIIRYCLCCSFLQCSLRTDTLTCSMVLEELLSSSLTALWEVECCRQALTVFLEDICRLACNTLVIVCKWEFAYNLKKISSLNLNEGLQRAEIPVCSAKTHNLWWLKLVDIKIFPESSVDVFCSGGISFLVPLPAVPRFEEPAV